jgi:hypothetical protein
MKLQRPYQKYEDLEVGDIELEVNSMWNFGARSVCFRDIQKTFGGGKTTIFYDVKECTDIISDEHTKWKQAKITEKVKQLLVDNGYHLTKEYQILDEIPKFKGTLEVLEKLTNLNESTSQ